MPGLSHTIVGVIQNTKASVPGVSDGLILALALLAATAPGAGQ